MRFWRKYINNRGSALFMVISTMTALMISCMAMYFSVISSRSTQYAIFSQQQSKQVSMSIAEAVLAGMMDTKSLGEPEATQLRELRNAMWALEENEKLTTGSNGYKEFDEDSGTKEIDVDLGAYKMEITRLPDEIRDGKTIRIFDIVVTSRVNGSNSVSHTTIEFEENAGDPNEPNQGSGGMFTATGYVPNDVYVNSGVFRSDLFFDNELTIIKAYNEGMSTTIGGNLAAGGSMTLYVYLNPVTDRPLTFSVRNTFTTYSNQPITFAGSPYEKSTVLIGGDAIFDCYNTTGGFVNANVYILGDLYLNTNLSSDTNYFVDGNVYVLGGSGSVYPSMKNVFCNGVVDVSKNCNPNSEWNKTPVAVPDISSLDVYNGVYRGKTNVTWNEKAAEEGILNITDMIQQLLDNTQTHEYNKWIINDYNPGVDKYVKELDESRTTKVEKELVFCQTASAGDDTTSTIELKYSEAEKGCIIKDIRVANNGDIQFNDLTILIDTGEDPDNVYTIRVKANRDLDGDGVKETFTWYPSNMSATSPGNTNINIYVKGRGSVVVDVPPGVTYQDVRFQRFMSYGWYVLADGQEETKTVNGKNLHIYKMSHSTINENNILPFIHTQCKEDDGCVYHEDASGSECQLHPGAKIVNVKCDNHGSLTSYCPECNPEKVGNHIGECRDHVDRKKVDDYLASHPDKKARMVDSHGDVIYPNTNIFLVSCDESANIRLSSFDNGGPFVEMNGFFGFIYAPYMTFKAYGENSGGGSIRMLGGMTVSDYIISDSMSIVSCYPDKLPDELMSSDSKKTKLEGVASKSWKITPRAH